MDPVGPWSAYAASYNRLAGATGGFQTGSSGSGDFTHHLAAATGSSGLSSHAAVSVPSTTTSQLLLQAAHATSSLAGLSAASAGSAPSPFNHGGFLSPPPVGYDAVFSPLFHHANQKAHYSSALNVSQHRQALSATKQSTVESELSSLRENYSSAHHQTLTGSSSFFDHQPSPSTPSSSIAWSHQGNSQLPSPFGILPHESVVPNSPGVPSSKASTPYENFNAHFAAAQTLNHLNSQLAAEYKNSTYSNESNNSKKSSTRQQSSPVNKVPSSTSSTFFQQTTSPIFSASENQNSNFSGNKPQISTTGSSEYNNSGSKLSNSSGNGGNSNTGSTSSTLHHQQTCIVSTPSSTSSTSKDYRIPQPPNRTTSTLFPSRTAEKSSASRGSTNFQQPNSKTSQQSIQTKAQTKIYPELSSQSADRRNDNNHESSQSSPISFAMMDATAQHRTGGVSYSVSNKISSNSRTSNNVQQTQFHNISQQQQPSTYRLYSNTGSTTESDYHHSGGRSKASSTDSNYSSGSGTQNGPDCNVVVPRRPSPLQAHSQASPLGHVPSPAYPMYNSPMASMSSPSSLQQHSETSNQCQSGGYKQNQSPQVTPHSPLDVTVPRPNSGGQVGYSSVITRTDKNYSGDRSFERSQEFPQKQCWDNAERQHRNSNNKFPGYNNMELAPAQVQNSGQQQRASLGGISERQQVYFDSTANHQVTLQDLSSCRGDPMSIVKNLQTLQQQPQTQCQVVQAANTAEKIPVEDTRITKNNASTTKRRRSSEKAAGHGLNELTSSTVTEYFTRVPPPAHHNANQQQQNGGYFDFERWNLPPPPPKMFSGGAGAFGSQTPLHHSSNFPSAHQHQSLMVAHPHPHHPPPPLPYFPTFHLPHSHHTHPDFQSAVDIPTTTSYNAETQPTSNAFSAQEIDDHPKVIVPNIEEELGFLAETVPRTTSTAQSNSGLNSINDRLKIPEHKPLIKSSPNSGFMASYLKFLQGERDTSPPPQSRGGRKAAWQRPPKLYHPPEPKTVVTVNGTTTTTSAVTTNTTTTTSTTVVTTTRLKEKTPPPPAYDPEDDPRYFPLPKTSSNRSLDSSSDSDSNDTLGTPLPKSAEKHSQSLSKTDSKSKSSPSSVKPTEKKSTEKVRPEKKVNSVGSVEVNRRRRKPSPKKKQKEGAAEPQQLPRREMSRRKAKEKTNMHLMNKQEDDDGEEDVADSDSDPAWTPAATKDGSDEETVVRRRVRPRMPVLPPRKKSRLLGEASSDDDVPLAERKSAARKPNSRTSASSGSKQKKSPKPIPRKPSSGSQAPGGAQTTVVQDNTVTSVGSDSSDGCPFKSGEFVVMKTDLGEEYPPIWRVDGKTLLQKYEPFDQNGETLYRNISTYSGWTPTNRHIYQQVPVKFIVQNRLETIVEFLRSEMERSLDEQVVIEQSMKDLAKYQDNFEVYIQTLISQALDSNFLAEILQERDEYFLSNVQTVDELTEDRRKRFLKAVGWKDCSAERSIATWPCYNIMSDLPSSETSNKTCAACGGDVAVRIILYGQPYNSTTLDGTSPDPNVADQKDFLMCRACVSMVNLYNKIVHQKYLMYIECAKRVADKRSGDHDKDTTVILNELLADENWLSQLFSEVRATWAEVDRAERQAERSNNKNSKVS